MTGKIVSDLDVISSLSSNNVLDKDSEEEDTEEAEERAVAMEEYEYITGREGGLKVGHSN